MAGFLLGLYVLNELILLMTLPGCASISRDFQPAIRRNGLDNVTH